MIKNKTKPFKSKINRRYIKSLIQITDYYNNHSKDPSQVHQSDLSILMTF